METVRAEREIILSNGAINSPRLLMLSGIGDADALKALGIAPAVDLAGVGRNLQDHLCTNVHVTLKQPINAMTGGIASACAAGTADASGCSAAAAPLPR